MTSECLICEKVVSHMSRHLKCHAYTVPCPMCNKNFSRAEYIVRHFKTSHTDVISLKCSLCNEKECASIVKLAKHAEAVHKISNPDFARVQAIVQDRESKIRTPKQKTILPIVETAAAVSGEQMSNVEKRPLDKDPESDNIITNDPKRIKLTKTRFSSNIPPTSTVEETGFDATVSQQFPVDYEPDNETLNIILAAVMDAIFDTIPVVAHPLIRTNWRLIRSMRNEKNPICREYNMRIIGREQGESVQQFFRRAVHSRQTMAYKVVTAAGFLLESVDTPGLYRIFDAQQNNCNLPVPPFLPDQRPRSPATDTRARLVDYSDTEDDSDDEQISTELADVAKNQRGFLVNGADRLKHFLKYVNYKKIIESARLSDTKWKFVGLTNVRFWVTRLDRAIGCADCTFPDHLKNNTYLKAFIWADNRNMYSDHLCLFRVISYVLDNGHLDKNKVAERFQLWCQEAGQNAIETTKFQGVDFYLLHTIEELFKLRINVYQLNQRGVAHLIRRGGVNQSACRTVNVDMYQQAKSYRSHFALILDIDRYAKQWFCGMCDQKFTRLRKMFAHEKICRKGQTKVRFAGGVHKETPNVFAQLKRIGVDIGNIAEQDRFYPFRVVYDFEALLEPLDFIDGCDKDKVDQDGEKATKKIKFIQTHRPISYAMVSNVPGFTDPVAECNENAKELVSNFIRNLEATSCAAYTILSARLSEQVKQVHSILKEAKKAVNEARQDPGDGNQEDGTDIAIVKERNRRRTKTTAPIIWLNKVAGVSAALDQWLAQLPVLGYNSGKYDLQLIQDYLYPALVEDATAGLTPDQVIDYDRNMAARLKVRMYNTEKVCREGSCSPQPRSKVPQNEKQLAKDRKREVMSYFDCEAVVGQDDGNDESDISDDSDDESSDKVTNFKNRQVKLPREIVSMPKVIKQGRVITSLSTTSLRFLDMYRYLAAGTSLDKFQSAWQQADRTQRENNLPPDKFGEIELSKIPFPYEYLDSVEKLAIKDIPTQDAFYSNLKGKGITDEEYAMVKQLYADERFTCFKDYLLYYNTLDVVPFLQAACKQFKQYFEQTGVDMFKECISLPGITLKYLSRNTPDYQFALWNDEDRELHESLRKDLTGGLSLVMNRLAVKGETIIRGSEQKQHPGQEFHKVASVQGYDANALYLYAMGQDMPVGFYTYWEISPGAQLLQKKGDSKPAAQYWLEYRAVVEKVEIITKHNSKFEERIGSLQIQVDGFCEETQTVYDFDVCYFHCHGRDNCKMQRPTDENHRTGATTESCAVLQEFRRAYLEELGLEYVTIWECEWQDLLATNPKIKKLLKRKNKLWMRRTEVPHDKMLAAIGDGQIFGFCQVNMDTPPALRAMHHFKSFPPIIKNATITKDDLSPHMKAHCEKFDLMKQPQRSLISGFKAEKQWFLTSTVKYLMSKGLNVTKVHKVIQYDRARPFKWFVEKVTNAGKAADVDPAMEILGQAFKLIGNCGYGKTITDITRHQDVYLMPEALAREVAHDPFLASLSSVGQSDIYEGVLHKRTLVHKLPEQIGMAVYNHAKIRMLEFAYDFLGQFCDPFQYSWVETDTDSAYLMLAKPSIHEIILPEMRAKYEAELSKWLVLDKKDKRAPGLFKLEYSGESMVAAMCKTYVVTNGKGSSKCATKGLQTKNNIQFEDLRGVLVDGHAGVSKGRSGVNTGIQKMKCGNLGTYVAEASVLSYLYYKRWVEEDGVTTRPYDHL